MDDALSDSLRHCLDLSSQLDLFLRHVELEFQVPHASTDQSDLLRADRSGQLPCCSVE